MCWINNRELTDCHIFFRGLNFDYDCLLIIIKTLKCFSGEEVFILIYFIYTSLFSPMETQSVMILLSSVISTILQGRLGWVCVTGPGLPSKLPWPPRYNSYPPLTIPCDTFIKLKQGVLEVFDAGWWAQTTKWLLQEMEPVIKFMGVKLYL